MTYIITITEIGTAVNGTAIRDDDTEHYRRRIQTGGIQPVIEALDAALKNIPAPRKLRSDAGKTRNAENAVK